MPWAGDGEGLYRFAAPFRMITVFDQHRQRSTGRFPLHHSRQEAGMILLDLHAWASPHAYLAAPQVEIDHGCIQ
jgi:hypothetical protein